MPSPPHQRMDRIAQRTLERVSCQPAVHFHVPDRRLDGAPALDHRVQRVRDAALLSRAQDAHAFHLHALVALVHDGRGWCSVGAREDAHLLQCLGQRVAVVGVARHGAHAHHQAFLQRGGDADLDAEFVGCPGFALADALHLGCVQRVELVLVLGALAQDTARALQQVLDLGARRLGQQMQLAGHLAVHAPHPRAQRAHSTAHALELLGVGVAPDCAARRGAMRLSFWRSLRPCASAALTRCWRMRSSRRPSVG